MSFDIDRFKNIEPGKNRYEKQLNRITEAGSNTSCIEETVNKAEQNLEQNINSFIIYGDPQSGKTEMMIALTAKLLDIGNKVIIVLLNDNVQLLDQNLKRFTKSGIDPTPKNFKEIMDPNVEIGDKEWIIFCKKNSSDLQKLISKLGGSSKRIIIDDEGDCATPNAKINKNEHTKINQCVGDLLGEKGVYIGVTATPARLDLNNTFENANDRWIYFQPHDEYTGQDKFFPLSVNNALEYSLETLGDEHGGPKYLRKASFSFLINVAYLNLKINACSKNYCMLIHTSGKRADHTEDYKQVVKAFNVLEDKDNGKWKKYIQQIWDMANKRYQDEETANEITEYIIKNISRNKIVVMNSDADKRTVDYTDATLPVALFTIAIGGNIVSRGVTFERLLSMFFTRDVKHKIQQDTYIQRARMFGLRGEYLKYFELTIPEKLYLDWHRCFVFHRLSLESIKVGNAPVWLEDSRVSVAARGSIDKTTVAMDSGEMSFEIFDYDSSIEKLAANTELGSFDKLKKMRTKLGDARLPDYLIRFIKHFSVDGENSLAIHKSTNISNRSDVDKGNIKRRKGLIGNSELERDKYPHAIHHIKIFYNQSSAKARVFYRHVGSIRYIKNLRRGTIV